MPRAALAFACLCLVSLLADVTYEGARSVLGPYLGVLGAALVVAGVVSVGDLVGYAMRGVGGLLARRARSSKGYWALTFAGYAINLLAVPALAFAGRWEAALALVMLERAGKGLRTPARDTILAEVTERMGRGKGFALHEVADQVGGVLGPLYVAATLYATRGGYSQAFLSLAIPAAASLAALAVAYASYPTLRSIERPPERAEEGRELPREFKLYVLAVSLMSLGYAHWVLASYAVERAAALKPYEVAALYSAAMLADALAAVPAGVLYDRAGLRVVAAAPVLAGASTIVLLSLRNPLVGALAWGLTMGLHETVLRAAVADLVPGRTRGYAYGVYGVCYGLAWTAGNVVLAALYPLGPAAVAAYVLAVEGLALAILARLASAERPRTP